MSKPFLKIDSCDGGDFLVQHNSNGGLGFTTSYHVDIETARLIELAIEEGKRRKAAEIRNIIGV